jgi:hypothetical protein
VFDKEFFATALPVAIGHYTAGAPAASPQVRLLTADGTEFVVRRVLAAAATWVSLEVIEDEDEPDRHSLLFVPYEHVRRVVFRPDADRPEQLGFRLHEPGQLDTDEDAATPSLGPATPTSPTSGQPPEVATAPPTPPQGPS